MLVDGHYNGMLVDGHYNGMLVDSYYNAHLLTVITMHMCWRLLVITTCVC